MYPCSCDGQEPTAASKPPKDHKEVQRKMADITANFETLFVVNATLSEEEIAGVVGKFKSLIEANGTVESVDEWGKRRMAYPIQDMNEGYYVLITFSAPTAFPAELQRLFNINDAVIRSIIIRK